MTVYQSELLWILATAITGNPNIPRAESVLGERQKQKQRDDSAEAIIARLNKRLDRELRKGEPPDEFV